MKPLQRAVFCFTSMVTASEALEFAGIRGLVPNVVAVVAVICLFYLPFQRPDVSEDSSTTSH